jgi:hypothetical protein
MSIVLADFDDDAITGNDANRILHEPTGEEGQQLVAANVELHLAVTATNVRACTHKIANLINVRFGLLCGLRSDITRVPRSAISGAAASLDKFVG